MEKLKKQVSFLTTLWSCSHIQRKPKTNNEIERKQGRGVRLGSACKAFFQLSTEPWPGFSRSCLLFSYFRSKFLRQCFACQTGSAAQIGGVLNWTRTPLSIFPSALAVPFFPSFPSVFPFLVQNEETTLVLTCIEKTRGTFRGIGWNLLQWLLDANFLWLLLSWQNPRRRKRRARNKRRCWINGANLGNVRKGHQQTRSVNSFIYT